MVESGRSYGELPPPSLRAVPILKYLSSAARARFIASAGIDGGRAPWGADIGVASIWYATLSLVLFWF